MDFKISRFHHCGIRSADVDKSIAWYEEVLGLTQEHHDLWKEPLLMKIGDSQLAIYPARKHRSNVQIDHYALELDPENFLAAEASFTARGIEFEVHNHEKYGYSLYLRDPDGHSVELVALDTKEVDRLRSARSGSESAD